MAIETRLSNTCTGWNQVRVYRDGVCLGWVNIGIAYNYAYKAENWRGEPICFDRLAEAIDYIAA